MENQDNKTTYGYNLEDKIIKLQNIAEKMLKHKLALECKYAYVLHYSTIEKYFPEILPSTVDDWNSLANMLGKPLWVNHNYFDDKIGKHVDKNYLFDGKGMPEFKHSVN